MEERKDKISIAMATYNGGRFLREQLDSLYSQTRLPDEVVVCDDGSTDDTVDILEEYHRKYGLKYSVNVPNLGCNENFIHIFSLCEGDFVFICDQDDIWMPGKIEKHYEVIRHQDRTIPVAVSSSRTDVDAKGNPVAPPIVKPFTDDWRDTLISTSNSQGCTMLMNRCLVDKVLQLHATRPEARQVMYDVLVSVTAAACGKKINTGIPLMYYRHHDANVIDRFRDRKKTFRERVHDMPHYYPFLMDYRIRELSLASTMLEQEAKRPDIESFLSKSRQLQSSGSMFRGLSVILSMSCLPWSRKLRIAALTPVSFLLKALF